MSGETLLALIELAVQLGIIAGVGLVLIAGLNWLDDRL